MFHGDGNSLFVFMKADFPVLVAGPAPGLATASYPLIFELNLGQINNFNIAFVFLINLFVF